MVAAPQDPIPIAQLRLRSHLNPIDARTSPIQRQKRQSSLVQGDDAMFGLDADPAQLDVWVGVGRVAAAANSGRLKRFLFVVCLKALCAVKVIWNIIIIN